MIINWILQRVTGGRDCDKFGYCRVSQEGQTLIIIWILQSVTGGTDSDNNLDISECYKMDRL